MAYVKYSAGRGKKHRTTPYSYRPGNTALHRLNPTLKLLALLVITTTVFLFGFYALAGAAALLTVCAVIARIRPGELLQGINPVLIMALLVTISRSVVFESPWFSPSGFTAGLLFSGNMVVCFA